VVAGATMPPPSSRRATLRSNSLHFLWCGTRRSARVAIGQIATRASECVWHCVYSALLQVTASDLPYCRRCDGWG
jgi:hypothetical protein